jgi:TonB family protein
VSDYHWDAPHAQTLLVQADNLAVGPLFWACIQISTRNYSFLPKPNIRDIVNLTGRWLAYGGKMRPQVLFRMGILIATFLPMAAFGATPSAPARPAAKASAPRSLSKWKYETSHDKMRGTTTRYARLESQTVLRFGFPYGPGRPTLMLRETPSDGLNVMILVHGQFLCNSYSGESVAVKFDTGPIEEFGCSEPTTGTGVLFIEDEDRFLSGLQKAKHIIVEPQFFEYGKQQVEFDVSGLNWKSAAFAPPKEPEISAPAVQPSNLAALPTSPELIGGTPTKPPYPAISQRLGEQGTSSLTCVIDESGRCVEASITLSSGSKRLDDAAIEYVKARYKWRPATNNGLPVRASTAVRIVWNLKDAQ